VTRSAAIVLASASESRAMLLRAAGIAFSVVPAAVDETTIKESMRAAGSPAADVAQALADLKGLRQSGRTPEAYVIGADQMLVCDQTWFDKPDDLEAARRQLTALSGRPHQLLSAVAVAHGDVVVWRHLDRATLTVRTLSPAFIERYLELEGDRVLSSVGSYRLEGLGAQLFSRIQGDYFTILGLPLLPLLDFLRSQRLLLV
jgi:septum formation protein